MATSIEFGVTMLRDQQVDGDISLSRNKAIRERGRKTLLKCHASHTGIRFYLN
jgi:hypothetical protein